APHCNQQAFDLDAFVNGNFQVETSSVQSNYPETTCQQANDANVNIATYVGNQIQALQNDIANPGGQPGQAELDFTKVIPLPLFRNVITSQSVDNSTTGSIMGPLQHTLAVMYAYRMTRD